MSSSVYSGIDTVRELEAGFADGQPRYICPLWNIWVTREKCKDRPCKGTQIDSLRRSPEMVCPFKSVES